MSPRERFQQRVELAKQFDGMVNSQIFIDGSDAAMLQMVETLTVASSDAQQAIHNQFRLDGARRLLDMLKSFSRQQTVSPRKDLDNLPQQ